MRGQWYYVLSFTCSNYPVLFDQLWQEMSIIDEEDEMAGRRGSDVVSPGQVNVVRWAEDNTEVPSEQVDTAASVATEDVNEDSSSSDSSSESEDDNLWVNFYCTNRARFFSVKSSLCPHVSSCHVSFPCVENNLRQYISNLCFLGVYMITNLVCFQNIYSYLHYVFLF